jgi:hypothetical protein
MMFDYPTYADMVGSTMKSMWAPFIPEKQHRDAFNAFVDAKVALNKGVYKVNTEFVNTCSEAFKAVSQK